MGTVVAGLAAITNSLWALLCVYWSFNAYPDYKLATLYWGAATALFLFSWKCIDDVTKGLETRTERLKREARQ